MRDEMTAGPKTYGGTLNNSCCIIGILTSISSFRYIFNCIIYGIFYDIKNFVISIFLDTFREIKAIFGEIIT